MASRGSSLLLKLGLVLLLYAGAVGAERLTFATVSAWQEWRMPHGLVELGQEGTLSLVRFRKEINALADAHLFSHPTQERGEQHRGGLWATGSGRASAENILDGDPSTWWQPDPADELKQWFVDLDLGRAVLAREIRLQFPDQEGARPFRQFTVYVTTGARIQATRDLFKFESVYRTTQPNSATQVVIPLEYTATDSVVVVDPGLDLDLGYENHYQVIQYISIVAEEKSADAALADVEVLAVGDNLSIGAQQRGAFLNGTVAAAPANLFDADMNTTNLITSGRGDIGWEAAGTWFYVDLGAVFFVDELFLYVVRPWEGTAGWHRGSAGSGHRILYSDGTRGIGSSLPVPEPLDYTELLTHVEPRLENLFRIRYLFNPRRMRYLFWHGLTDRGWLESKWAEWMLFSPGYPSQVVLTSPFIDLGDQAGDHRPKVIKSLSWDALLPPLTRLQVRSRSGNTLNPEYTFYDKKGQVVTEEKWKSLPNVVKGGVDTALVVGQDWGNWSNVYHLSGEPFQSDSPRRFVQLELILSTDDPQQAPTLHWLSLEYEQALLQQALGSIQPRRARPNEETRFTYTLWPRQDEQDSGFDLLRLALPHRVDPQEVSLRVGGQAVHPRSVSAEGDSLLVALSQRVLDDSVEVDFTTKVVDNATVFGVDLGLSGRPGLWQSVEPASRRANVVLLPELTASHRLIGDLRLSSGVLTPNGDGVHDRVELTFVAFKVEGSAPRVGVYDLAGGKVVELGAVVEGGQYVSWWDGRDGGGQRVIPGLYVCRLDLGAEAGEDTALRFLAVAY
jgi:hypothetical protein